MTNRKNQYRHVSPKIEMLVKNNYRSTSDMLNLLFKVQGEYGALTREILEDVASLLDKPASQVYGIASFYSMIEVANQVPSKIAPRIRVCDGPVCWLCGGRNLEGSRSKIVSKYPNGKFERSSCLGLCDLAPAALIEEEQSGPIWSNRGICAKL
jgi:NADH-quinone oxidoreductase subunit E